MSLEVYAPYPSSAGFEAGQRQARALLRSTNPKHARRSVQRAVGANRIDGSKRMDEGSMIARNSPITLNLSKGDFVHILKACEDRREKLDHLQRTSDNEDVIAEAGNDLVEINMIIRDLKSKADEVWGESGWTTSNEYL